MEEFIYSELLFVFGVYFNKHMISIWIFMTLYISVIT